MPPVAMTTRAVGKKAAPLRERPEPDCLFWGATLSVAACWWAYQRGIDGDHNCIVITYVRCIGISVAAKGNFQESIALEYNLDVSNFLVKLPLGEGVSLGGNYFRIAGGYVGLSVIWPARTGDIHHILRR
jgi:hypothetical protein